MRMKHTGDYELEEINMLEQECADLEEENKKLNEKVRFLEECLDNKEKVNKSLREELSKYKKLHKYSNGELLTYKGGELMEEDTLQELRDIGEI